MKSAITYFPAEQYHRRGELHFCVRDGNRCFLDSIVTDKTSQAGTACEAKRSCRDRVKDAKTKSEPGSLDEQLKQAGAFHAPSERGQRDQAFDR